MGPAQHLLEPFAIRKTYYTSVTGSEEVIQVSGKNSLGNWYLTSSIQKN